MPRLMTFAALVALLFGGLLAACSGNQITEQGRNVLRAASLTDVKGCERLGSITAKLATGTSVMAGLTANANTKPNDPQFVNDLLIDARNQAGAKGGNRILATNEPYGGTQEFDVYRCPQ